MMKTDGWPTYHLASVVDDHHMGISHVLRGEEWLPSVTKHHQLYRAFGWAPPAFAHLPLLVNADGTKLSKRTGDVHVERYAERGYEPEAMLNFLALLGWDYHGARRGEDGDMGEKELEEVFSLPELVEAFDIGGVTHRRAAVSLSKLDYINKMTLRRKATSPAPGEEGRDALVARFHADLRAEPSLASSPLVEDAAYVGRVFDMELERVTRLNELPQAAAIFFLDPDYSAEGPKAMMGKLKKDAYGELPGGVRSADLSRRRRDRYRAARRRGRAHHTGGERRDPRHLRQAVVQEKGRHHEPPARAHGPPTRPHRGGDHVRPRPGAVARAPPRRPGRGGVDSHIYTPHAL